MLCLAIKDSFFVFNGTYYEQRDGVGMGPPLDPTIANIFLCYWEEVWINKCPTQFRPIYYNMFMDDTFVLFSSSDHVLKFHKYINSHHKNMTFTYEIEENNSLAFLDVLVAHEEKFAHLYNVNPHLMAFIPISKVLFPFLIRKDSYSSSPSICSLL